ncbi:CCR4-NOT transcription complex subunit 7 isoform X2 [Lepeophtheirus salmonis]|nr:CCR4-NOT transcription complex subunit 7-like isoform X2 [Lepeophtheirus salmonis]
MSPAAASTSSAGVSSLNGTAHVSNANGILNGGITNEDCGIREVWSHNLEEEFKAICQVVKRFPFVAMDTEFPGVVARPIGEFKSTTDYQYQLLRCNVDLLKIIQVGLTFLDEDGTLPEAGVSTWQFNFKFNLTEDMYAEDSVDLLQNSGIQFEKHETQGIDRLAFAELMLSSGLVLLPGVKWLSFHSGYDFGYLLNLLTNQNLPISEGDFFELLKMYFPAVYDVKYLMKSCKNLKGGLQEVANELEVPRIGPQHQAGSDALLTGQTFFKMKEMFFEDDIDDSKYCGHLYGLGTNFVGSSNSNGSTTSSSTSTSSSSTTTTTTTTAPPSSVNSSTTVVNSTTSSAPSGSVDSSEASTEQSASTNENNTSDEPAANGVSS